MPSIGHKLTRERETRGASLDELAGRSGVARTYLEAMERDEYAALPGRAFGKLYIRMYAEVLGFDPSPLIREYDEATRDAEGSLVAAPAAEVDPSPMREDLRSALKKARAARLGRRRSDAPRGDADATPDPVSATARETTAADPPAAVEPERDAGPSAAAEDGTDADAAAEVVEARAEPNDASGSGTIDERAATGDATESEAIDVHAGTDDAPVSEEFGARAEPEDAAEVDVEFAASAGSLSDAPSAARGHDAPAAAKQDSARHYGPGTPAASRASRPWRMPVAALVLISLLLVAALFVTSRVAARDPDASSAVAPGDAATPVTPDSVPLASDAARGENAAADEARRAERAGFGATGPAGLDAASTSAAAAPPAAAPAEARATSASGLRVTAHGVGTSVRDLRLVGEATRFENGQSVSFLTRVVGGRPGDTIRHVWRRDGGHVQTITLRLGGAHWRTHSSKSAWGPGTWTVEARAPDGTLLATSSFEIVPRR